MQEGKFGSKSVILFLLGIIITAQSYPGTCHSKDTPPNVILIAVDDLNDWIGCLGGHPQVKTPNIDRLAAKGVLFANAHCQTSICNPSRASLMTSLYPSTTGIYFNAGRIQESPVASENVLLTRRFENEGYHVIAAGKLYHTFRDNEHYIKNYAGNFGGFGPLPEEKFTAMPGNPLWDWGVFPERDEQLADYKIAEWAVGQLNESSDQPLFLGMGFYRPHVPLYTPRMWFDLYPEETTLLPEVDPEDLTDISDYAYKMTHLKYIDPPHPYHEWMLEHNEWLNFVRSYLASISFVDQQIGKVLDTFEQSSFKDNTYIVLFGDHGFHLGEKKAWAKQTLWENGTRTPLIIIGPGIPEGKVCNKPVQLMDIYPTLLELTGHEADPKHEGHSLVPLLHDVETEWPHMARSSFGPGNFAIRSEGYRYIHYNDGSEEFYNHHQDPNEWKNQISHPDLTEIIQKHRDIMPAKSHPVISSGSTGHKIYDSLGVWFQTQSETAGEKQGQFLDPEDEMAIIRYLNKEDRLLNRQPVLSKPGKGPDGGDHISGEWLGFTTMFLNGPTGRGIIHMNLKQEGDVITGTLEQLKHPFDSAGTIRYMGKGTGQGTITGELFIHPVSNMMVLHRHGVNNNFHAIFTATIDANGRIAIGQLVNSIGVYGTMLMIKREALADFQFLLTEEGRQADAAERPKNITRLEAAFTEEHL